mgnify:CR=1 FL=1
MIVFDIGAHNGISGWKKLNMLTRDAPGLTIEDKVYAFEPTPWLVDRYLRVLERGAPDNFIVVPKAVSLENGTSDFHLSRFRLGCSSLHEFDENVPNPNSWNTKHFKIYKTIKVEATRLDTFIISNNIDKIDYLHCDAQGGDLDVLKSLGDKIDIVREGVVEAHHVDTPLYNNDNSINSIVSFLDDRGLKIQDRDRVLNTEKKEIDIHFSIDGTRSKAYWP